MRIVIFLRDDIYQHLQFEDKNKITESAAARIEWDTGSSDNSLKSLMEKRSAKVFNIPEPVADLWLSVHKDNRVMSVALGR